MSLKKKILKRNWEDICIMMTFLLCFIKIRKNQFFSADKNYITRRRRKKIGKMCKKFFTETIFWWKQICNVNFLCFKTYLNHPINQKTLRKKKPKGDHSSQKRGGGVWRGMTMITDSMVFFKPSLIHKMLILCHFLNPSPMFCSFSEHKKCRGENTKTF